jgi:hypothetical protein
MKKLYTLILQLPKKEHNRNTASRNVPISFQARHMVQQKHALCIDVSNTAQHINKTTAAKVVTHLLTSMVKNYPCFPVKNFGAAACALN